MRNIRLLKYSHIKYGPLAQKNWGGGVRWGGQAEPTADGGWGEVRLWSHWVGSQGQLKAGRGQCWGMGQGRVSLSALFWGVSSTCAHASSRMLVGTWQSQVPTSSLVILFSITRSVHPPWRRPKNKLPWPHFPPQSGPQRWLEGAEAEKCGLRLPSPVRPSVHPIALLPK